MKLKNFHAPTLAEAMTQIREDLGDEAIIVSTYQSQRGRGTQVTAAIEDRTIDDFLRSTLSNDEEKNNCINNLINECLNFHCTPENIVKAINKAADSVIESDNTLKLAGALDSIYNFEKIPNQVGQPIIVAGPPGSGKTSTTARLAARYVLSGKNVTVVTTDSIRAGAFQQLNAFTKLLDLELKTAETPKKLESIVKLHSDSLIIVDTPAMNPLSKEERNDMQRFVKSVDGKVLLVLAATMNPTEAGETAEKFATLGAKHLHITQIDCCRRLGTLLEAAFNGKMTVCEIGMTPFITNGLAPINPVSLARLLMYEARNLSSAEYRENTA